MYAECLELLYNGLRLIKPGVSSADVVKEWPTCDYWGLQYEHEGVECCICHGIGCSIHEGPLVHRMASLANPITFKEGMVLAIETWIGRDNPREGARIEEEFVVTKDGPEIISKWPVAEITECWV
jgi:Xaa-Pro aminopeptidase